MKKSNAILAIALSTIVISACGVNNRGVNDTAYRNRNINEPTRVSNPGYYNNAGYNYYGNRTANRPIYDGVNDYDRNQNIVGRNVNDTTRRNVNDTTRNETSRMRVADRVADKIASMPEVDTANVIVTNDNAYVGAKLANGTNLSRSLERKIADQVKAVDTGINDVYISVNPDFYDRMNDYSNDIRNGKPIGGFFNEFTDTVQRVFPTHINR